MRHPLAYLVLLVAASPVCAQWVQQGPKLVGTGGSLSNQGISVALSADGNSLISGGESDGGNAGAAWVFTRVNGVWTQQGPKLVGSGATGNSNQGVSVAMSADGNTALVGGFQDNSSTGAAWVFTRSNGQWTQQGPKLVGSGFGAGPPFFGVSLALSGDGNTAAIGGYGDSNDAGAVWVFSRNNGTWSQQGTKLIGTGAAGTAEQGASVSLSRDGNTLIEGGFTDNASAGAAWVFTRSGNTWTQVGSKLVGTGAIGSAFQGASVALSGDGLTAAVGGYANNNRSGGVWTYQNIGGTWTQIGSSLFPSDASGAANVGTSVSLSADGSTAVIGGPADNNSTGAAWVFVRSGSTWMQQGPKLVANGTVGQAYVGASVSISADGRTVTIGGFGDKGVSLETGAVWVFDSEPPITPRRRAVRH